MISFNKAVALTETTNTLLLRIVHQNEKILMQNEKLISLAEETRKHNSNNS